MFGMKRTLPLVQGTENSRVISLEKARLKSLLYYLILFNVLFTPYFLYFVFFKRECLL